MTVFIYREMQWRLQDDFSILLPVAEVVRMFGEKLKIYCIAAPPQEHSQPHLILNLSQNPNVGTPIVNDTNQS